MPGPKIVALFPGQGSQTGDLRERAERALPDLVARCQELVGEDPFPRVADSTRFAQPAIFCASLAGWYALRDHVRPVAFAGHSLGELTALVAAGALDPESGLRLAVGRGKLMAAAAGAEEGMLAVLGADDAQLAALVEEDRLTVANENAPGQVVLAGDVGRLRSAAAKARERGYRAVLLDVAGAFHSPAMAPAVAQYREALRSVSFEPTPIPVYSGVRARPFADVRDDLAAALVEPVRWRATMRALADAHPRAFVDLGPGEVLARLTRRNLPEARVIDPATLTADSHGVRRPRMLGRPPRRRAPTR